MDNQSDKNGLDSFLDKSINFVFSNDSRKWLLAIVILGVILRIIVASNIPPVADEMVHGVHALGVSKLAPLSTMTQGPVWFYLTDYAYRIFGVHLLTARFLSVIFGSFSIILVYLIASKLFNREAGLLASLVLALSTFHITWAAAYQDQTMMFFVLLASYLFIRTYEEKKYISLFAALALGMAMLVKIITGVFIIVFGVFILGILYTNYKSDKKLFKRNLKRTVWFGVIIALCLIPLFSYNYFLYSEKGIVDLPFAQFLKINTEFYMGPGLAHGEGFVLDKLPQNLYSVFRMYFIREDITTFLLGLAGIGYILSRFKQKRFGELFLVSMFFFSLVFIASAIVLQTHYTSFFPLFSIFAGGVIIAGSNRLSPLIQKRYALAGILIILFCFSIYSLWGPLTSQSGVEKARAFAIDSIDSNALVVVDARTYRGTNVWMFYDKHYVESNYLSQLIDASEKSRQQVPIRTLFVECVDDDCGWGTVKDQPEFNESVEKIVEAFQNVSKKTTLLTGGGSIPGVRGAERSGEPYFKIYETIIPLDPSLLLAVDQSHTHFFYRIPRNADPAGAFDHYEVKGTFNSLLNVLAYGTLYLLIILAVISLTVPIYLLFSKRNNF